MSSTRMRALASIAQPARRNKSSAQKSSQFSAPMEDASDFKSCHDLLLAPLESSAYSIICRGGQFPFYPPFSSRFVDTSCM